MNSSNNNELFHKAYSDFLECIALFCIVLHRSQCVKICFQVTVKRNHIAFRTHLQLVNRKMLPFFFLTKNNIVKAVFRLFARRYVEIIILAILIGFTFIFKDVKERVTK